jgi:hypothetical protein
MARPSIVVDGANVAYAEKSHQGDPKVSNLVAMRSVLTAKGYDPLIIVDASLVYEVDDKEQLEALLDEQVIRQAPADTDADYFVLAMANELDAKIVSNDRFEAYRDQYGDVDERRVPFMIVDGNVELYGPALEEE